jgi:2',3'-cyclic-nucleotide 2'-phosphodiesterase (5'-nucleotidase family)
MTASWGNATRIAGTLVLGAALVTAACDSGPASPDELGDALITVLYTNDEHGWIAESAEAEGAAKLMGLWRGVEGYDAADGFLVLSGGDNWTGPAISTWFEGASTVEVMNAMGYNAAAIGNHEFDFTVNGLRDRIAEAQFPYLSANIRLAGSGDIPDFTTPYVIREVSGVHVGLVGLTTLSTPYSTFPTHVADYDFIPYAEALEEWVPQIWDAGAEIVLVIGHICHGEMSALVPVAHQLGISMIGGGHCNQLVAETSQDVALIQAGWQMGHYAKLEIEFDLDEGTVRDLTPSLAVNTGGTADPVVAAIVQGWEEAAAVELSVIIGYVQQTTGRTSATMQNLVTDSWLFVYPTADIAMTNAGGIRQSIPSGDITRGTIVSVLPFQNNLVELELTGSEVIACLDGNLIVGGMTAIGGHFHSDGTPLKADSVYSVLTTDYLYARDDHCFLGFDNSPYQTGMNYRQPTMDYIESLATGPDQPLDNHLDHTPRR